MRMDRLNDGVMAQAGGPLDGGSATHAALHGLLDMPLSDPDRSDLDHGDIPFGLRNFARLRGARRSTPRPLAGNHLRIGGYRAGAVAGIIRLCTESDTQPRRRQQLEEARLASEIARYLQRFDPLRSQFLSASCDEDFVGSLVVDGRHFEDGLAEFRWYRVGQFRERRRVALALLDHALLFCRERGFRAVRLLEPVADPDIEFALRRAGFRFADDGESLAELPDAA
jgi:hypothetical protein